MEELNFNWTTAILWFVAFWFLFKLSKIYFEVKDEIQQEELRLLREAEQRIINVKIEKQGDMFYLFSTKDDSFVAQGLNIEEIKKHMELRFKDRFVFVATDAEIEQSGLK